MFKFESSLAYRLHNFAIKVEKLSKDNSKKEDISQIEELAKLRMKIEKNLNQMYEDVKQAEMLMKKQKEEKQHG
ncbi:MAG: hypothetical protein WC656_01890 [Sulfurimonas sp.]|jgi:hypothetical protein